MISPFQFRLLILTKLPIAWIAGLRLHTIDDQICTCSVPFGWLSQNPFRSIFWAVQGMAAEMTTGLPILLMIQSSKTPISMLVVEQRGRFLKKGTTKLTFTCDQIPEIKSALDNVIKGEPQTLTLTSRGHDEAGVLVSEFDFVWSMKKKV